MARIRIRVKETGQTGSIDSSEFDPTVFEQVQDIPNYSTMLNSPEAQRSAQISSTNAEQARSDLAQLYSSTPFANDLKSKGLLGELLGGVVSAPEYGVRYLLGQLMGIKQNIQAGQGNKSAQQGLGQEQIPYLNAQQSQAALNPGQDFGQDLLQPMQAGAGIASAVSPVGKGVSAFVSGGLRGLYGSLAQDNPTPTKSLLDSAGGAIGEGVLANAIPALGKILKKGGNASSKAGESFIRSQYNVPRSVAMDTKLGKTVGELSDYGLNNINDVANVSPKIIDQVSKVTRGAVSKARPVDTKGIIGMAENIAMDPSMPAGQDVKFVNYIKKGLQSLSDTSGSMNKAMESSPLNTLDFIKSLESKAADITKGKLPNAITDSDRALAGAYKMVASELKDRLFSGAGADQQVVNSVTPEIVASLRALGKPGEVMLQNMERLSADGKLNVSSVRSLLAPFVRGSQAAQVSELGGNLSTNTAAGAAKGLGKLAQNPLNILAVPLSSDTVNAGIGGALKSVGNMTSQIGGGNALLNSVLGRVGGAVGDVAANPTDNTQNYQTDIISNQSIDNKNNNTQEPSNPGIGSITPEMMARARLTLSDKKYAQLKQIYDLQPKVAKLSAANAVKVGQGTVGLKSLSEVENMLKDDPALLTKRLAPGSVLTRDYESAAFSAMDNLLRIQTGATAPESEIRRYVNSYMPRFGDSPEVAQKKIARIRETFKTLITTLQGSNQEEISNLVTQ